MGASEAIDTSSAKTETSQNWTNSHERRGLDSGIYQLSWSAWAHPTKHSNTKLISNTLSAISSHNHYYCLPIYNAKVSTKSTHRQQHPNPTIYPFTMIAINTDAYQSTNLHIEQIRLSFAPGLFFRCTQQSKL